MNPKRLLSLFIVAGAAAIYEVPAIQDQPGADRVPAMLGAICAAIVGFILVMLLRHRFFDPQAKPASAWHFVIAAALSTIAASTVPKGAWDPAVGGALLGLIFGLAWFSPRLRRPE